MLNEISGEYFVAICRTYRLRICWLDLIPCDARTESTITILKSQFYILILKSISILTQILRTLALVHNSTLVRERSIHNEMIWMNIMNLIYILPSSSFLSRHDSYFYFHFSTFPWVFFTIQWLDLSSRNFHLCL